MNSQDLRSRHASGSSRSSTSNDSHPSSSSPTGTLSSVATSSSIHFAEGSDDKQAARVPPLSGLSRRASSIKRIFSKGKKNAVLVDEPASYFVPEAETSFKGWKIAFAGADGEHGLTIASILRDANLGLTGIPNALAGSPSSRSAASSYSSEVEHAWAASESTGKMANLLHKANDPHSLFHTSHTPAELEHLAHLMGGLDALVIDLRGQTDPRQKALQSASSLIDVLVPALSVPDQPSLWDVKGKNTMGREEPCQCGQLSPVLSCGQPLASPSSTNKLDHGAVLAHRLSRVLSHGSASSHCPLSTRKASPPSTPSPVEPVIPYARIVLIAEADAHIQPVIGYFESLQALSSEQITNKLQPRVEPIHPQARSSSPQHDRYHHHDESSLNSKGSRSSRTQYASKRSDSVETSRSVETARFSARRLKPIILEASLVEECLKPALLGQFDDLNGVWFGSGRLSEMRRAMLDP